MRAAHLVQFSTGAGSAEVAMRVFAKHPESTVLISADTNVEDDDNWRYADEIVALMPGVEWAVLRDGRTPMQVGRDLRVVPNNRMAVCSRVLKRELIRRHLDANYDPAESVVYLGYDWTEAHRLHDGVVESWRPWTVAAPLMEPPYLTKSQIIERHRALGVEPPRLYAVGFSHANCGGACVRGGQTEWRRLLHWNRPRYLAWEAEEEATRALLGKDVAILRDRRGGDTVPVSLRSFRERLEADASLFDADDVGACGCDPWSVAS